MVSENEILKALSSIIDPDFHQDIVSLGFIKNIKIAGSDVSLDIDLTTPACPVRTEFQKKAEELVGRLDGVKTVTVKLTSQPRQASHTTQIKDSTLNEVASVIAVSSCKGGVGKSTVAACLARELSHRGFQVGLIDADIYGPSIPTLFNLQNTHVHVDEKQHLIPLEVGRLKIMSFGFLLGDAPAVMRGPLVSRYIQQLLHQTEWGKLDYLFIDMPPGTGDIQLTITQSVPLSGALIVTTRHTLSLIDVARGILMFETVNVPILGIIENMAYFICDQCQTRHYIFGGQTEDILQERFGLETLAQIPILPELTTKLDHPLSSEIIKEATDRVVQAIGKTSIAQKSRPTIQFDQQTVSLAWNDGKKWVIKNRDLRLSCRCALCVDELSGRQLLRAEHIRPDIVPEEVVPLGNYALGIKWNDGHASGIYPYKSIEVLAIPNRGGKISR